MGSRDILALVKETEDEMKLCRIGLHSIAVDLDGDGIQEILVGKIFRCSNEYSMYYWQSSMGSQVY